jgi:hypothetical protein
MTFTRSGDFWHAFAHPLPVLCAEGGRRGLSKTAQKVSIFGPTSQQSAKLICKIDLQN